jgi:hypothetical protein
MVLEPSDSSYTMKHIGLISNDNHAPVLSLFNPKYSLRINSKTLRVSFQTTSPAPSGPVSDYLRLYLHQATNFQPPGVWQKMH